MLTLLGDRHRYCDGVSRRSFLKIGSLSLGAASVPLTLPQLLANDASKPGKIQKSVIVVYMSGGQSHQDTFDLKTQAPKEIRGEFNPISTNVPGTQICELLPLMAQTMDKCTVIRSGVGQRDEHTSWQNLTGYPMGQAQREGRPNFGSVVSRLQ